MKIQFLGLIDDKLQYNVSIGDENFSYFTGLGWLKTKRESNTRSFDLGPVNSPIRIKVAKVVKPYGRLTVNDVEYLRVYREEPTEQDILECLYSDADFGSMSFSEFCDNCGYSNDSINALEIYRKCEETAKKMRKLEKQGLVKRSETES